MPARSPLGLALVFSLLLAACQAAATSPPTSGPDSTAPPSVAPPTPPPPSSAPIASADGPAKLVADLRAAGAEARLAQLFDADPFEAQGVLLCVGKQPVQLYVFGSIPERVAAGARIDPTDPSNMGTTMVTWNGQPRFWGRDRLLILYLGTDAATDALLRNVLGQPFASGQGRPLLRDDSCA